MSPERVSRAGLASRRVAGVLPVLSLPLAVFRLPPSKITEEAANAAVDRKLDAALKETIARAVGSTSPTVDKVIQELQLDLRKVRNQTIAAVITEYVVPALRHHRALGSVADTLAAREVADSAPSIASLLELETPLARHPLFIDDVRRSRLSEALRITEIPASLADAIDANKTAIEAWDDRAWDAIVESKVLTKAQRDDLRFTADLGILTEDYALVEAARASGVRATEQLVALDRERWRALVEAHPTAVPEGTTAAEMATAIDRTVQRLHPSRTFTARLGRETNGMRLASSWSQVSRVVATNPELFTRLDVEDIDWTGLAEADLAPATREAIAIAGTYRHLDPVAVAHDATELGRRIAHVERFLANHRDLDLRELDLLDLKSQSIDWTGIDEADRPRVRNQVLAYQRVLTLAPEHDLAIAVLRAGFDSSSAIAAQSFGAFLRRTGLCTEDAEPVYTRASQMTAKIANGLQLLRDATSGFELGRAFQGLVDLRFANDLKDIPGYAALFGRTAYCECDHCRSMFSPAAYFTDLMYFIDKNISTIAYAGKPNNPNRLRNRRPDLWLMRLTCENTDTLVPHVTLVCEILDAYLDRSLGLAAVPQALAADRRAIGLPFHGPLAAVREYLHDWNLSLVDVYELLRATAPAGSERLGLADAERQVLADVSALDTSWHVFPTADQTRTPVDTFLRYAGLSRDQLTELAATSIAGDFTIRRVAVGDDIQQDVEFVEDLTEAKIDRIGRLLRLARSTRLSLTELDALLRVPQIGGDSPFSDVSLGRLSRSLAIRARLGLSVEAFVALLDHIPSTAMTKGGRSLAQKVGLARLGLPRTLHHAQFATVASPDTSVDPKLAVLLGVTGLSESELLLLLARCAPAFPFDSNGKAPLTAGNVALLAAYATLARTWKISVADLVTVVEKRVQSPGHDFRSLADLEVLVEEIASLEKLPRSIAETFALLNPDLQRVPLEVIVSVVSELEQTGARWFGIAALTAIPGLASEAAAAQLEALVNAGLVEVRGDRYALTAAYTPATELGPVLATGAPAEAIHTALLAFHFHELLPNALARVAGMATDKATIAFAYARTGWDSPAMLAALATPIVDGQGDPVVLAPLVALANDLARTGRMFADLGLDTADAWFVAQYPAVFAIADIRNLDLPGLLAIRAYREWRRQNALSAAEGRGLAWQYHVRAHGGAVLAPTPIFATAASAPLFAKLLAAGENAPLVAGPPPMPSAEAVVPSPLAGPEIELWAERAGLDLAVIQSILEAVGLPADATTGLPRARELYGLCQTLGIRGGSLRKLTVRDFSGLQETAQWLLELLHKKYPDEVIRAEHISKHTRALDERRRDALCDYVISRPASLGFVDRADLYAYFLIDVEIAACFDTSRLVAAISSLQLYVHRCLMNLETSKTDGLAVLPQIDAEDIQQEWAWRRNYRVWEANRKVFLYPESYLEPELRDDKTPLFETLEENLLQREITLEAAEEAYHDYLATFSTLANLKIVACCFDDDSDTFWFVARSHSDPYTYFLRQCHQASKRWEPWEAVDVGIGAPSVAGRVHLGRLYLFWAEVASAEKTDFVGGNSMFTGIEHQVQVQYTFRESNGKWAAAQKLLFLEHLVDRAVSDETPEVLKALVPDEFAFVGINKARSRRMANAFRATKTHQKVFTTVIDDTTLRLHYYREFHRTEAAIKVEHVEPDPPNVPQISYTYEPVSDRMIDKVLIKLGGNEFAINDSYSPSLLYYRTKLDLLTNRLFDRESSPYATAYDGQDVPYSAVVAEDFFYDSSEGVGAIGLYLEESADDPDQAWIALMRRRHAEASRPAATDAMLVTSKKLSGQLVSQGISAKNTHDAIGVTGKPSDTIVQHWKHQHWIHLRSSNLTPRRLATRVNTTLDTYLTERLFVGGLDEFLTLETQTTQGELRELFQTSDEAQLQFAPEHPEVLPFKGAYGLYYQELFFHIPFLIANQLNSQGRFEEAKRWYEKIFNPMAPAPANDPNAGHRVWQYFELRDVNLPKLKELLTNDASIEVYHDDPFNPHAIARLRLSAHQKAIVMKYVDNLIDWGDDLFTQATMESVNEAIMLYVLSAEILGPRPVSVGPCDSPADDQLTYATLGAAIEQGSEFLMYVENLYNQASLQAAVVGTAAPGTTPSLRGLAVGQAPVAPKPEMTSYTAARPSARGAGRRTGRRRPRGRRPGVERHYIPAFCVPPNEVLLGYWDRLEDRLYKIRHCLDINGDPLKLPLFQPPIDPMLLVRAKAAGLSIESVVGRLVEPVPSYRFTYLVEKARQYTGTVQSLGSSLLSALEKKDGELLAQLRSTHEQNIMKLQRATKQQQIDEARAHHTAVLAQQRAAQAKVDHLTSLLASGLNTWETLQQAYKHTSTGLKTAEAALHLLGGILWLLPDTGSPFAMKYGGSQLGASQETFAQWYASMSSFAETAAGSAGLEASFQRRNEDWEQNLALATEELAIVDAQVKAADLRVQIAERDLRLLDRQLEHAAEVHEFLKSKFTNAELYTYLSAELMKLYREAYQLASRVARQAERAFQFERDSTTSYVLSDNWQSDRSGLLAGERLQLQLARMEKVHLETNVRELEVRQSFSLLQLAPNELQSLRQTGGCQLTIDEAWFDVLYPGHYRRLIKSVRLTIPCVAGPYINVAAKLQLLGSQVRRVPDVAPSHLVDVPLTMTRTIATSHGQNDGGTFELNFRDERYLPFEGAGAVNSTWSLELPAQLRMFDYATLADVIVTIDYTSRYDGAFSTVVQANLLDRLKAYAQQHGLFRLVSMRHEFPDAFYQLCNPPPGQASATTFSLERRHVPAWLGAESLTISQAVAVWPQAKKGATVDAAAMGLAVEGTAVGEWASDGAGSSRGTVTISGSPVRAYPLSANTVDRAALADLVLLIRYSIA